MHHRFAPQRFSVLLNAVVVTLILSSCREELSKDNHCDDHFAADYLSTVKITVDSALHAIYVSPFVPCNEYKSNFHYSGSGHASPWNTEFLYCQAPALDKHLMVRFRGIRGLYFIFGVYSGHVDIDKFGKKIPPYQDTSLVGFIDMDHFNRFAGPEYVLRDILPTHEFANYPEEQIDSWVACLCETNGIIAPSTAPIENLRAAVRTRAAQLQANRETFLKPYFP